MTDSIIPLAQGPEFDRIRAIVATLGKSAGGLGDDCAVLPGGWCVSTDLSVEGVHFRREWLAPEEIGWRATASALSDLAAMGAAAEAVLVAISAPPAAGADLTTALMAGAGAAAAAVGARVVGGDLSRGDAVTLAVTVLGRADRPVGRGGARVGDGLWVTGSLGGARAALEAWQRGAVPDAAARRRFARPEPRVEAGRGLAERGARAMIDLSDGLAADARHLAAAGGVGFDIDLAAIPVDTGVAVDAVPTREAFAAAGGEDYELLVVLPASHPGHSFSIGELAVTRVGVATATAEVRLLLNGRPQPVAGYDHFR